MKREARGTTAVDRKLFARWLSTLLFLSSMAWVVLPRPANAAGAAVAVVVNPATPVDALSLADVRKIFLGDRQFWNASLRVVLLVRAPVSQERNVVLRSIYQMSEAQFRQYWIAKIFRDQTTGGPKIVYSPEMTHELITAIPGSIAFIAAEKVQPGVKVVRVNGKLPGESGYPLQ